MTPTQYLQEASRTVSMDKSTVMPRFDEVASINLLHAAMGLSTEANELLDAMKKHFFYGKELDLTNIVEEIGDAFWYCALACNTLGISFEQVMKANVKKLQVRYEKKFSEAEALKRNIDAELAEVDSVRTAV